MLKAFPFPFFGTFFACRDSRLALLFLFFLSRLLFASCSQLRLLPLGCFLCFPFMSLFFGLPGNSARPFGTSEQLHVEELLFTLDYFPLLALFFLFNDRHDLFDETVS